MKIQAALRMLASVTESQGVDRFMKVLGKPKSKGVKKVWSDSAYDASLDTKTLTFRMDFSNSETSHVHAVGNTWEELLNRTRNQASGAADLASGEVASVLNKLKSL